MTEPGKCSGRSTSVRSQLARFGFSDPQRAERLLGDQALAGLVGPPADTVGGELVQAICAQADPDRALLGLVRLAALTDHLIRHPEHWDVLAGGEAGGDPFAGLPADAAQARAVLLRAVGADPQDEQPVADGVHDELIDALRAAYLREVLGVAGRDLSAPDPAAIVDQVAHRLADLADAALEAALAIARHEAPEHGWQARLAVIGMGKCGGQELNYVSDVDVIYVVEPADGAAEDAALRAGTVLAAGLARACSAVTAEGTLWPVDANLRPEGKDGPLVRTIDSHRAYYRKWAHTWEFQALLKARVSAGDRQVGQRYLDAVSPLVWEASAREGFIEYVQAMRRRVEDAIPAKDADRQLKLGPGGLRDVEFSIQLLQFWPRYAAEGTWGAPTPPPSTSRTGCCGCSSTACSWTGSNAPT